MTLPNKVPVYRGDTDNIPIGKHACQILEGQTGELPGLLEDPNFIH
jgi:hypothetical protein